MPRYDVQNNKGEWACFSTVVNDFITDFMPRDAYEAWRKQEYGVHCRDIKLCNLMDYHEAMRKKLCLHACNKGYNLAEMPEFSSPCDYCNFWNKETKRCEIVERQDEVILYND